MSIDVEQIEEWEYDQADKFLLALETAKTYNIEREFMCAFFDAICDQECNPIEAAEKACMALDLEINLEG